jgi:hypothetical protein
VIGVSSTLCEDARDQEAPADDVDVVAHVVNTVPASSVKSFFCDPAEIVPPNRTSTVVIMRSAAGNNRSLLVRPQRGSEPPLVETRTRGCGWRHLDADLIRRDSLEVYAIARESGENWCAAGNGPDEQLALSSIQEVLAVG